MSPTRTELVKWLATKEVKGKTLDIGGTIWSMKGKVKSFEGKYDTLDENGADLNYVWGEGEKFDNVFCNEVLQFVYNPFTAMTNIHKILYEGGTAYFSFHLTHSPMKSHDYLRYTEKGIRKLLDVTGFSIDEFLEPLPGYFLVQCSRR